MEKKCVRRIKESKRNEKKRWVDTPKEIYIEMWIWTPPRTHKGKPYAYDGGFYIKLNRNCIK